MLICYNYEIRSTILSLVLDTEDVGVVDSLVVMAVVGALRPHITEALPKDGRTVHVLDHILHVSRFQNQIKCTRYLYPVIRSFIFVHGVYHKQDCISSFFM